jgi:triosephosphate isomerase
MNKWIVGNWKMNGMMGSCRDLAAGLVTLEREKPVRATVVVCPPYPYLGVVALRLMDSSLHLGGQDCSAHEAGAFTGQVSAKMLKDLSCEYVIVGHSERRAQLNENNDLIRQKVQQSLAAGLTPIICIGENLEERETGKAIDVVLSQVQQAVPKGECLIAYEPVWAIGTGKTPNASQIREIHQMIARQNPGTPVLYGGSVKSSNASEILAIPHVHGLLVGGASLDTAEFWKIAKAA